MLSLIVLLFNFLHKHLVGTTNLEPLVNVTFIK